MNTQSNFDVDLTNCDREPIHELGAIQSFGFLILLSSDWLIARASANLEDYLGIAADDATGLPLSRLFDEEAIHTLRNRLTLLRGADAVERVLCLRLLPGSAAEFDCALHVSGGRIVIECEPATRTLHTDTASLVRSMMGRLDQARDLAGFFREAARQVRALTGIDRVMVYRFDRDGSGEVVAEAVRGGLGSFMGLRYPASDIPKQARALYLRNPFRVIADIEAAPVPVLPRLDETGAPLDLSLSVLRSVSPIHIEYLRNMGVRASLSISIIVEGKLWGLFACHHHAPHCPDFERRTVAELFGHMFALKLESRERLESADYEARARTAGDRLLAAVAGDAQLLDDPEWVGEMLRDTVPADGVAIWIDGRTAQSGSTPPTAALPTLVRRLNAMAAGRIYATDHIAGILPEAGTWSSDAAGVLAMPISRSPRDYVLLFRQERVRTVKWAGDPHKPASYGRNGPRLSPRESFATWSQEVRERSAPFTDVEIRVAETLRASLLEIVLRMSDDAQEERRRASERQELLIAELNHRVRNILALIRGLVRQSRGAAAGRGDYIELLEGRIESLARAHDQITQDNWGPARLKPLIETEAAAYLGDRRDRLSIEGCALLLTPHAFSTLALVFHELVTNSAKYGSLSDSGRVMVRCERLEDGAYAIEWTESGGPPVREPTRRGFGSTIIQRSIPYDLGGKATVEYRLSGFRARFVIPAAHVAGTESAPPPSPDETALQQERANARTVRGEVLLVEDSLIIAMDAEDILLRLGADRVTTASGVAEALDEVDRGAISLAVLDFNLGSENSLPIAERLHACGVPFVFASGYGDQLELPPALAAVPIVQKPYTEAVIARTLEALFEQA